MLSADFYRKFENIYIGWGHKFSSESFGPAQPSLILDEYPVVQELFETDDPTPEQEAALKKAMADNAAEEGGEEGEEEQEEEDNE